ncbi:MAG: diguanylate cyclase [Thermodesulfovibrionaceae bacterium]
MLLRKKIIAACFVTLLIFLSVNLVFYLFYTKNILNKFGRLKINEDIKRVENFFNHEKNQVLNLTKDWAAWTDAWLFMQGMNPNFEEINLKIDKYVNNNLHLIAYVDLKGYIKTGGFYDISAKKIKVVDKRILRRYIQWYFSSVKRGGFVGIVKEKDYFMIIAVHPVVKSDFRGPVAGYLFMGRVITSDMENFIKDLFGFSSFKIISAEDSLSESYVDKKDGVYRVTHKLDDFFGKKTVAIYFETEKFSNIGLILLFLLNILIIFGFGVFVLYLISRKVLKRIDNVVVGLQEIRRGTRDTIETDEKDEIGFLIEEINDFWRTIKRITLENQKNERVFRTVADNLEDIVIVIDSEGEIVYSNNKAQIFMKTSEKLRHLTYKIAATIENQLDEEEVELEDKRYLRIKKFLVYEKPKIILILGEDITSIKREKERLMELAIKDDLTSLYNRFYFEKALQEKVNLAKIGEKFSLIFITVENLKEINEERGRVAGDFVVKFIAKTISSTIRSGDIAARWSGSKFGIILKGGVSDAKEIEEKIIKLKEVTLNLEGQLIPLSVDTKIVTIDGEKDSQTIIKDIIS